MRVVEAWGERDRGSACFPPSRGRGVAYLHEEIGRGGHFGGQVRKGHEVG